MENANIKAKEENNINNGEKTFNKLLQIQSLIKKESSLKELCKSIFKLIFTFINKIIVIKTNEQTKKQINNLDFYLDQQIPGESSVKYQETSKSSSWLDRRHFK